MSAVCGAVLMLFGGACLGAVWMLAWVLFGCCLRLSEVLLGCCLGAAWMLLEAVWVFCLGCCLGWGVGAYLDAILFGVLLWVLFGCCLDVVLGAIWGLEYTTPKKRRSNQRGLQH